MTTTKITAEAEIYCRTCGKKVKRLRWPKIGPVACSARCGRAVYFDLEADRARALHSLTLGLKE